MLDSESSLAREVLNCYPGLVKDVDEAVFLTEAAHYWLIFLSENGGGSMFQRRVGPQGYSPRRSVTQFFEDLCAADGEELLSEEQAKAKFASFHDEVVRTRSENQKKREAELLKEDPSAFYRYKLLMEGTVVIEESSPKRSRKPLRGPSF